MSKTSEQTLDGAVDLGRGSSGEEATVERGVNAVVGVHDRGATQAAHECAQRAPMFRREGPGGGNADMGFTGLLQAQALNCLHNQVNFPHGALGNEGRGQSEGGLFRGVRSQGQIAFGQLLFGVLFHERGWAA